MSKPEEKKARDYEGHFFRDVGIWRVRGRKVVVRGNRADKGRDEFRQGCEGAEAIGGGQVIRVRGRREMNRKIILPYIQSSNCYLDLKKAYQLDGVSILSEVKHKDRS